MKNTMKKIASAALALTMTLALAACGAKEAPAASQPSSSGAASSAPASSAPAKMYKIGISQFGEHPSLDNCRMGFLQGLEEAGLKEGVDYEINYMNASFDTNICTQIGTTFSAENVDLMVGIATPSATACYAAAEDKNIPVIFTAITDPVEAKLDSGNVTGTSDKLPVEAQLDLIRQLQPRPSASFTPPASPTPSPPSPSMRPRLPIMALPLKPWASPPRLRSPRPPIPSFPGRWTA